MRRLVPALLAAFVLGCGNDPNTVAVSAPEDEPPSSEDPLPAPIVLLHGMGGFATLGAMEYWSGVPAALTADGHRVFVLEVDPIATIEVRATQAAAQIDAVLAATGAAKVHLIAHSQGGLDARHLISVLGYGDRIATLTTLATTHHGTPVTDIALGLTPGAAMNAAAAMTDLLLGEGADFEGQLLQLSKSWIEGTFNPAHPDDPRVAYYSAAGVTQPFLAVDTSAIDIVDPALAVSYGMVYALEGDNDGLVSVTSATWGTFLGEVPADHADEIGWWPNTPQPAFDHIAWYRSLAAFLAEP